MARPRAATFDFHDTIAIAPAWFALEVRQLPGMVLYTLAANGMIDHDGGRMERATAPYRALRMAIHEHGIESDALAGVQHALRAVDVHVPDAAVSEVIDTLMASVRADARPRPGIFEAVQGLADADIRLAVVSNAVYHPFLEWCLTDWGLDSAFVAIVSSARCGYYKSHQGIYRCALDAVNAAPEQTVHIGDSYRFDIEAPHRLGMKTVWLNLKGESPAECVADLVVTDLDGLAPRVLDLA